MISVQVQHYRGRARDFLEGMNLLKDDLVEYRFSSALLGIHCAISYCDALRIGLGSGSLASDDHRRAADELKSLLASRKFVKLQGADQVAKLIAKKSRIAYAAEAVKETEVEEIVKRAERFAIWAEETGKALGIMGWRDE